MNKNTKFVVIDYFDDINPRRNKKQTLSLEASVPIFRDVVLSSRTGTRVVLKYNFSVLVLVLAKSLKGTHWLPVFHQLIWEAQSNANEQSTVASQLTKYVSIDCPYDPSFDCFS